MNLRNALQLVGQEAILTTSEGLRVLVAIADAKESYGIVRLLIRGQGRGDDDDKLASPYVWVNASRIRVLG